MFKLFVILIVISALMVIGLVLVQESKGGGLISQFGDIGRELGIRKTNSFLERSTWVMTGVVVALCIACACMLS